mgnify:FL=1
MPDLSIVIPVYNVEIYLERCIDSILSQINQSFELILVDDGSTDHSGAICDQYAEKDERILVIHQNNKGVSAARNVGIDIATGTYLAFVDADDWVMPEAYAIMLREALISGADIIVCGVGYVNESGRQLRKDLISEGIYNSEEALATLYGMPNHLGGSSCNKLFLKESVKDIKFREEIRIAEDWLYLFECYTHCQCIKKIPDCIYIIRERVGSATRSDSVVSYYEMLAGSKLLLLLLARKHSYKLECKATDKFMDDCLRYVPAMKEIGKRTGQPYRLKLLHIKWLMLKVTIRK